jgi:hypothetical protein
MTTETQGWTIARTVPEIDAMIKTLADQKSAGPSWDGRTSSFFGSETLWPLMVRVPEYIAEGNEVTPLTVEAALEDLRGRVDFLIEKADNERGLSAPKARDQVNMLLWLLGREDLVVTASSFGEIATQARRLRETLPAGEDDSSA